MALFIVLIVKLLKMGGETEIASTCSEENIGRNPKLVGYINHGGAEHVDDEAGDDGGIGKLGNGVSDICFWVSMRDLNRVVISRSGEMGCLGRVRNRIREWWWDWRWAAGMGSHGEGMRRKVAERRWSRRRRRWANWRVEEKWVIPDHGMKTNSILFI